MVRALRLLLMVIFLAIGVPANALSQNLEVGTPVAGPAFDGEFTDVSDYWTIAWTEDWQVTSYSWVDYGELLQLSDEHWTVRLQGPIYDPLTDAGFLPGNPRTALIDLATAIGVEYPLMTESGRPLQNFSGGRAWRVYLQENGEPIYLDVRSLGADGSFLYIMAWAEGGTPVFNEHYERMLLLLENIQLLR